MLTLAVSGSAEAGAQEPDRYDLAGGCYSLLSQAGGAKPSEGLRMQASDLGSYLLYDGDRRFVGLNRSGALTRAEEPSPAGIWVVQPEGGAFTVRSQNRPLAVARDGELIAGSATTPAPATRFSFQPARGCPGFPEVEVNAVGEPLTGETEYGEVRGFLDMHVHPMFFEALGGAIHCGRPWSPLGVSEALPDCEETLGTDGAVLAPVQNFLNWGSPVSAHDPVGWPTFNDWPNHHSLTYEQVYYKWIERAWRGGLRLMTPLAVDNAVLCELYPFKRHGCNEMNTVLREIKHFYELQDYIDAQEGGPGEGWFRIVRSPFEARRVINDGKLAVILGIETSKLFDCGINNGIPQCDREQIRRGLNQVYRLGVRQMEIINKFDTAFGGVAGDGGILGPITNFGNFYETGDFLKMGECEGHAHDNNQSVLRTDIGYGLAPLLPAGTAPVYPEGPHCNQFGLTELGEYLIDGMMKRGMLIDPDHLSVIARSQALSVTERSDYSGVISSHSWADEVSYPRIYDSGGVITPYAGSSTSFVDAWRQLRPQRNSRYFFGFSYGSDMNGFGAQGAPRMPTEGNPPVRYPFKSFDGGTTLYRQQSGSQTFDINTDGVAHYGLYPDWIEDLRILAGDKIVNDMARGAEAYLQTWERAIGIPPPRCRTAKGRFSVESVRSVRLGLDSVQLLQIAGQPKRRVGDEYRYCVQGRHNRGAAIVARFGSAGRVTSITTDARGYSAGGVEVGDPASAIDGANEGFEYVVQGGKVRSVGISIE